MKPEERASRLVGDMPWVTDWLSVAQIEDLKKQIGASMQAAVADAPAPYATHRCQLCDELYPECCLFDLKNDEDIPGGAKVTCSKCWGKLEEREACARFLESKRMADAIRARN